MFLEQNNSIKKYQALAVLLLLLAIIGLLATISVYLSKSNPLNPFTADCSRYSNPLTYRAECVYSKFEFVPIGVSKQFIARNDLNWLGNERDKLFDVEEDKNTGRLKIRINSNPYKGAIVDRVFRSPYSDETGVITVDKKILIFANGKWQRFKTRVREKVKAYKFFGFLPEIENEPISAITISSNGKYIFAEFGDATPRLYPQDHKLHDLDSATILHAKFSQDNRYLALIKQQITKGKGDSQILEIRDAESSERIDGWTIPLTRVIDISFAPDGSHIAILTTSSVVVYPIGEGNKAASSFSTIRSFSNKSADFNPYERVLMLSATQLVIFGSETNLEFRTLSTNNEAQSNWKQDEFEIKRNSKFPWRRVALFDGGKKLIALNGTLEIWDVVNRARWMKVNNPNSDNTKLESQEITAWALNEEFDRLWWGTEAGLVVSENLEQDRTFNSKSNGQAHRLSETDVAGPVEDLQISLDAQLLLIETLERINAQTYDANTGKHIETSHSQLKSRLNKDLKQHIKESKLINSQSDVLNRSRVVALIDQSDQFGFLSDTGKFTFWDVITNKSQLEPRSLDMTSGLLHGDKYYIDLDDKQEPVPAESFIRFKNPLLIPDEQKVIKWNSNESFKNFHPINESNILAVGSSGGLYLGTNDEVDLKQGILLTEVKGWKWYRVGSPEIEDITYATGYEWNAVGSMGDIAIAVGNKGLLGLSTNAGRTWDISEIKSDTASSAIGVSINPDLVSPLIEPIDERVDLIDLRFTSRNGQPYLYILAESNNTVSMYAESLQGITQVTQLKNRLKAISMTASGFPFGLWLLGLCSFLGLVAAYYLNRRYYQLVKMNEATVGTSATSDKRLGWGDPDAMGLSILARQVSRFIRNENTDAPLVLGVSGQWGTGKSSLMSLIHHHLEQKGASTVWFNAWHQGDEEHLLAALFENIRANAIPPLWTYRGLNFRLRLIVPRLLKQLWKFGPLLAIGIGFVGVLSVLITTEQIEAIVSAKEALKTYLDTDHKAMYKLVAGLGETFLYSGLVFLALLVWATSLWRAIPTPPATLVKKLSAFTSLGSYKQKINFRYRFAKDFGDLCRALRTSDSPGLIIFIDDLDRCDPKSLLTVLEAVNYLTSAGDCMVIMGYHRARVEQLVASGYVLLDEQSHKQRQADSEHYLEKLINIEIEVPELSETGVRHLVMGESSNLSISFEDEDWHYQYKPKIESSIRLLNLFRIHATAPIILLIISFFVHDQISARVSEHLSRNQSISSDTTLLSPKKEFDNRPVSAGTETNIDLREINGPQVDKTSKPEASSTVSNTDSQPSGTVSSPSGYVFGVTAVYRKPAALKNELVVAILFVFFLGWFITRTLRGWLASIGGGESKDPPEFIEALQSTSLLVNQLNNTPRALKRFLNHTRLASIRQRNLTHDIGIWDKLAHRFGYASKKYLNPGSLLWRADVKDNVLLDKQTVVLCTLDLFFKDANWALTKNRSPLQQLADYEKSVTNITAKEKRRVTQQLNILRTLIKETDVDLHALHRYLNSLHTRYNEASFLRSNSNQIKPQDHKKQAETPDQLYVEQE